MKIQIDDQGNRIGESHPKAKFTDKEIEEMRVLADAGWSYQHIAWVFGSTRQYVGKVVRFEKRSCHAHKLVDSLDRRVGRGA